jgi:hypothetical protein
MRENLYARMRTVGISPIPSLDRHQINEFVRQLLPIELSPPGKSRQGDFQRLGSTHYGLSSQFYLEGGFRDTTDVLRPHIEADVRPKWSFGCCPLNSQFVVAGRDRPYNTRRSASLIRDDPCWHYGVISEVRHPVRPTSRGASIQQLNSEG